MLHRRLHIGDVCQGFRHCPEADTWRDEPIHLSFDLRLYHRHGCLHPNPDELLQQGA